MPAKQNGSVRWLQLPILIPPIFVLLTGAVGVGFVQAQVQINKENIEKQEAIDERNRAEALEGDGRLRARVRATEQNQAVVNSRTQRIEMDINEVKDDLKIILQRLPTTR